VGAHFIHEWRDKLFELSDFGLAFFATFLVDFVTGILNFGDEFNQALVIHRQFLWNFGLGGNPWEKNLFFIFMVAASTKRRDTTTQAVG
jgi:hypothetical protein